MRCGPVHEGLERIEQRSAKLGEFVLDARRHLAILASRHDAVPLEITQRFGENLAADAPDAVGQLPEPEGAVGQCNDEQGCPLARDPGQ